MGNRFFGLGIETTLVKQVAIKAILDGDPILLEERVTSIYCDSSHEDVSHEDVEDDRCQHAALFDTNLH